MKGLYLKVLRTSGRYMTQVRIGSFMLHEETEHSERLCLPANQWIPINKEPEMEGDKFRFMKCLHCGHHDFRDDGEDINEYVCCGCEKPIGVLERKSTAQLTESN